MSDYYIKFGRGQKRFFRVLIGLLILSSLRVAIYADQPSSTTQGGRPAGSYNLSDFDNINLFNGNLNFRLPLLNIGGRGEAHFTISVISENKWTQTVGYVGQLPVYTNQPETTAGVAANFGELEDATTTYEYNDYGQSDNNPCQQDPYQPTKALIVFNLKTGDGTAYPFHPLVNSGRPIQIQPCPALTTGTNMGKEFVTWDGSGMKLVADYDVYHNGAVYSMRTSASGSPLPTGWTVLFPNGTRYRIQADNIRWLEDRNGNRITFYTANIGGKTLTTQIKDSLGRIVTIDYNQNQAPYGLHTKITYKGFDGVEKVIRVNESLKIWLPDQRTYNLIHNEQNELTRVELPTGGAYEYDWGGDIPPQNEPGNPPGGIAYRYVTERRVYADGVNLTSKMTFTREFNYPNTVTRVDAYDGNSNLLSRSKHYFYDDPRPESPNPNPYWADAAHEENANLIKGREYLTESYDADGATLLRKLETNWQPGRQATWTILNETHNININQRVEFNKTTLTDVSPNLVSQTSYLYNQGAWANTFFNVLTDVLQYDYGQGAPGTFLTRSHNDYVSYDNGNYQTQPYIPLLLSETWTSADAGGNYKASRVKYEYDNYPTSSPLENCPNIIGHNPLYGTSYQARGNVTKVTSYADAQNQSGAVSVYSKYDIAGNVVKKTDARNYATTFDFSDRFGTPDGNARLNSSAPELLSANQYSYAFPTLVTNALGHTVYIQYDYYQGVVVDNEDVNGVSRSMFYNDALDRLNQVVTAIGTATQSQTTFTYDDLNRRITTTSDLNTFGDGLLKSESLYDGLGRTTEARSYEPDGTFITVASEYDALSRVKRTSNPYRSGDAVKWTASVYDALGRPIKTTTPDGAEVNNYYRGQLVLIKDQAGKESLRQSNALSQLEYVWEITVADNATEMITFPGHPEVVAGYKTVYDHDALGNLKTVTQREGTAGTAQIRSFTYNSLSLLTAATNPESGTISYSYNANGNLETKTEPRLLPGDPSTHVITTYAYDALGRVQARTYNDGITPNVTYEYDAPGVAFSKGRLTKVSSSVSDTRYGEFDAVGHVKQSQQVTDGHTYPQMLYTYNLAGNLKTETYPSGRVVTHLYDHAGRLSSITGQQTGESVKTYGSEFSYKAHGAVGALKLGNNLWEHTEFNARLQLKQIGVGTISTDSSVLALDYTYGTTNNNGNVQSQTITLPNLTLTQTYSYDALNRLKDAQENNGTNWKQTFIYDRFGNRKVDEAEGKTTLGLMSENPLPNPVNNRITPRPGELYQYDTAGNLIRDKVGNTYDNDAEGRLVKFNGGASASGGATYTYDGEGKRVKKVTGGVTTIFIYNAKGQLLVEYSSAAAEQNGTQYVTADHLGSPRVITGANGSVRGRHDYRPFGEEVSPLMGGRNTVPGYAATDDLKQKFTGYERDSETELDYAQARYFSNIQGRFTTPDPLLASGSASRPQTWNRYSYALNNPLRFTDPSGLTPVVNVDYFTDDLMQQQQQQTPPSPPLPPTETPLVLPPPTGLVPDTTMPVVDSGTDPLPPSCPVNPITGIPGFDREPINGVGNLRSDSGGDGSFTASRRGKPNAHQALDIAAPVGTPVVAVLAGTVTYTGDRGDSLGERVTIDHGNGIQTTSGHLQEGSIDAAGISRGQRVERGQQIGNVGTTGNGDQVPQPHVHIITRQDGRRVDPAAFLNRSCPPR